MLYFLAVFLAFGQTSPPNLSKLLEGVDRTFNRMKDFSADFVQFEQNSLNQKDQASGHLYLARPRMMRWEYKQPEEYLFVSDGKMVYMYVPADRQVRQDQVKDTLDNRIPLMFLVGRSNLRGEFEKFELLPRKPEVEGMAVIQMYPKRKTDLAELLMEVDPRTYLIRRLVMTHADGSSDDFRFSNIRTDGGLKDSLFKFKPPAGVTILEGIGQ
jgi:outer membrane lipoprotein carrier protein